MKKLNKHLYETNADGLSVIVKHKGKEEDLKNAIQDAINKNQHLIKHTGRIKDSLFEGSDEETL